MADLLTESEGLWAAGGKERNIQMSDILGEKTVAGGKGNVKIWYFCLLGKFSRKVQHILHVHMISCIKKLEGLIKRTWLTLASLDFIKH